MIRKMKFANSAKDFHVWIPPEVIWARSNSIFKMDWILTADIINEKTFWKSQAVKAQALANRIVDIYLPAIIGLRFSGNPRAVKSHSPLSLLQVADRCRNKTTMPRTTAGHYAGDI
jgi:hypothetical protein